MDATTADDPPDDLWTAIEAHIRKHGKMATQDALASYLISFASVLKSTETIITKGRSTVTVVVHPEDL